MNYLAHLFLAKPSVESRVGNLLGDFAKGVDTRALSPAVLAGLNNHRWVDRFTDTHPDVVRLKKCVSKQRRRFAGIMLDMAFDHYLIKHWARFSPDSFSHCCQAYYASLLHGQELMPKRMQAVSCRIVEQDWFTSYADFEGIGFALDRIAARIRFPNEYSGAIEELTDMAFEVETVFLRFMPELIASVTNEGPESE